MTSQCTKVYANIFSFFCDTIEIKRNWSWINDELPQFCFFFSLMEICKWLMWVPCSINELMWFWLAYNSICVITYHTLLSTIMHPGNPFFFHCRGGIFLLFFGKEEEGNLRNRSTFYCHKWVGRDYIWMNVH